MRKIILIILLTPFLLIKMIAHLIWLLAICSVVLFLKILAASATHYPREDKFTNVKYVFYNLKIPFVNLINEVKKLIK